MKQWHGVRLQVLCVGVALLLVATGTSSALMNAAPVPSRERDERLSRLVSLHKRGKLKQQLRQTAVLAATIDQSAQPDCTKISCIALTFDDGPNPITTPQIIAILEAEHVTATFFVIGSRVPGNEGLLQRMHADGDEIGNHSWTHPNLTTLPPDQIKQQIDLTQNAIVAAGVPAPTLFRPPYGAINQSVSDNSKPLTIAFWNEDPKDWAANNWQQVLAATEATAKPGGVIDMHDIYHVTANSLQPLIQNLKTRNFQFVTMSQLMVSYPSPGEFYGGYRP